MNSIHEKMFLAVIKDKNMSDAQFISWYMEYMNTSFKRNGEPYQIIKFQYEKRYISTIGGLTHMVRDVNDMG